MILISVVMNLSWVETRAAGGQYTDFPISIRILYLFMAIGTAILVFYLRKLTSDRVTSQT